MKGADAQARQVSWHYTVDDRVIYQSLPVNEVGWHAKQGNSKSIGIEICMHRGMNEARAYDRAALLVAVLALQNGIPVPSRIVQHHFWTEKHCPRVLRDKPNGWTDFLAKVQSALTQLRSAPKVAPQTVTHAADYDACEVLNSSAPKGAARSTAKSKTKSKAKSKVRAKAKTKAKSKARRTKSRKRPRKT
jgi:N-acetylmuramoyl-L-alanine amidase CwlA